MKYIIEGFFTGALFWVIMYAIFALVMVWANTRNGK